jgi:hypothetical protein
LILKDKNFIRETVRISRRIAKGIAVKKYGIGIILASTSMD